MNENRLFLALEIPVSAHRPLQLVQDHLPKEGVRWTLVRHFHLTLKFLGEVDFVKQVQVQCAARDVVKAASFSAEDLVMKFTTVDVFRSYEDPTVVWAGVGLSPALYQFQYELDMALAPLGFEVEKRKFRPHITLARLRSLNAGSRKSVESSIAMLGLQSATFSVEALTLYKAHRSDDAAPDYEVIEQYPFSA